MKLALAALLALALVPAPADAAIDPNLLQATALGTVTYTVTDSWTGARLCDTVAALEVEAGMVTGAAHWTARDCPQEPTGAAFFLSHCTDLCFLGCDVRDTEIRCSSWTWTSEDGWTSEELVLLRDGSVTFTREVQTPTRATITQMQGTLFVATWP